jgi:hypothetical protein
VSDCCDTSRRVRIGEGGSVDDGGRWFGARRMDGKAVGRGRIDGLGKCLVGGGVILHVVPGLDLFAVATSMG